MSLQERIKSYLYNKIKIVQTIMDSPGSLEARFHGCYFGMYELLNLFRSMNIKLETIIDIGANRGMFTKTANYFFPEAKIIAFEPLKNCFAELINLKINKSHIECYNLALSNSEEEKNIYHSEYDYSSSILEMDELHKNAFPYSAKYKEEKIMTARLDDIININNYKRPILMKIDVQGYENYVIEGAIKTMKSIDYIICEMSFQTLYKDQILFDDLYKIISNKGFKFLGPVTVNKHPITKIPLQIDGLFQRL